jgi:hypothetical protein
MSEELSQEKEEALNTILQVRERSSPPSSNLIALSSVSVTKRKEENQIRIRCSFFPTSDLEARVRELRSTNRDPRERPHSAPPREVPIALID